jgi:hypothetical protein
MVEKSGFEWFGGGVDGEEEEDGWGCGGWVGRREEEDEGRGKDKFFYQII